MSLESFYKLLEIKVTVLNFCQDFQKQQILIDEEVKHCIE